MFPRRFDPLVAFVREKHVIQMTRACMQRIYWLTVIRHGIPHDALAPPNVNTRVFLTIYMIAHFPVSIFENMGSLEQALFDAAIPLLKSFEGILYAILRCKSFSDVSSSVTKDFPQLLFNFLCRFKAWKGPDEQKVTTRIKLALISLYKAERSLPLDDGNDANNRLREEMCTQIRRLREKMRMIAGPEALGKFDDELEHEVENYNVMMNEESSDGSVPQKMTNEQMAHEIMIDPSFRIDDSGPRESVMSRKIRETFHDAFWDCASEELRRHPPCYHHALKVIEEVSASLAVSSDRDSFPPVPVAGLSMNPVPAVAGVGPVPAVAGVGPVPAVAGVGPVPAVAGVNPVPAVVDMELVKRRMGQGLFSPAEASCLVETIVKLIERSQMPRRAAETAELFAKMQALFQREGGANAAAAGGAGQHQRERAASGTLSDEQRDRAASGTARRDLAAFGTAGEDRPAPNAFRLEQMFSGASPENRAPVARGKRRAASFYDSLVVNRQLPLDFAAIFCMELAFLLDRVNVMRIDAANARIAIIGSAIKDHGIDYERGKFRDKLNLGRFTLINTTAWLVKSVEDNLGGQDTIKGDTVKLTLTKAAAWLREVDFQPAPNSSPAGASNSSSPPSLPFACAGGFDCIYLWAVLDLVCDPTVVNPRTCPETLLLDVDRIRCFQEDFAYIVSSVTLLVRSVNVIGKTHRHNIERMGALLASGRDEVELSSTLSGKRSDLIHAMCEAFKDARLDAYNSHQMELAVRQASDKKDAIYKLMSCRMRAVYSKVIALGRLPDGLSSTFPVIIQDMFPLVAQMAFKVKRTFEVSKAVHGPTYATVFEEKLRTLG